MLSIAVILLIVSIIVVINNIRIISDNLTCSVLEVPKIECAYNQ